MFEKFGELNSFGEINELAENLFNEGDTESLKAMAKENGIQSDFVDMYLQGEIPVLCDQLTAALGKIDVEVAELKPKEIMEDWVEYLRGQCMENELLAFNVRKKGKSLKGCIAALLMWSFKNQQTVDKDIIKAAGVADDISQLVEKFYQDNELILNAVYGEEFDEQTINRFIEIVNPAGNRSYKKGLYFMMMYENRVTFKKFGDTPKDMTWWEFYQLTREIFDDTAAGTKTWQNHFGGVDDEESTVQDTANEPGREENATKAPKPEDDGGAVGETGANDVQEIEKGGMEDHGAADEAGTGQEEDDTDGEESGQADCEEPAERTDEQTGAQSQREEIAPAQKSTETLEKEEVEDDETGENESSDAENQTAESEPETAEREQTEETEVIEAVYGTRKEYMDRLSEQEMAEYMADEYKSHRLLVTYLANTWNLRKWLSEKVDRFGKPMEDAR
jgi:hypothetical protein